MILQALNRYYDILAEDPDTEIPRFGYSKVGVSFALNISADGELLDVLPMFVQEQRGKRTVEVPRPMIVPEYAEPTSNDLASFLCGKCDYVLGISKDDDDKPERSANRFAKFQRFNIELLRQANTDPARAVIAYLETHDLSNARGHPAIFSSLNEILKAKPIVFMYSGSCVHEDSIIQQIWESYYFNQKASQRQCLVTGELAAVAIKHRKISGRVGKKGFNAPFVSFNKRAFESYNRTKQQGMNSPISERAAFAYSTALNYLLSNDTPNKKFYIGDAVMVYWAESTNRTYEPAFASFFDPAYAGDGIHPQGGIDRATEVMISKVAAKVTRARPVDVDTLLSHLEDENPRFYILGLTPVGDGRLAVRFFINDLFENIVQNIEAHYHDLHIAKEFDDQPNYLTVSSILDETVSPKAKDKEAAPLLAGAVVRAILTNTPYPAALYNAILNRIRADMDDSERGIRKINYVRAAVIKAFLIRKYRHQPQNLFKEVLTMALNEQSTDPAYLLGRLFAVLEKVQQEAIGDINASIKDRYFTSACASPRTVFPTLLRLSQHHIAKAEYGYASDRRIEKILNKLDVEQNPIPARLTLDEQGVFVLGYYHQRADFYTKEVEPTSESVSEFLQPESH